MSAEEHRAQHRRENTMLRRGVLVLVAIVAPWVAAYRVYAAPHRHACPCHV